MAEKTREGASNRVPAGQHVRHPRRNAEVVFQDHEAVCGAHDVAPTHRDVGPVPDLHPLHFRPVVRAAAHQFARHGAVVQDMTRAVDIGQKEVQGLHALGEPAFEVVPLLGQQQARHAIDREDPLNGLVVSVHGEGNALVQE